jgi:predicted nucleic acid-binding protein
MGLIYLDSCLLIYLVEKNPRFEDRVRSAMTHFARSSFCISPLVMAECLAGVIRARNLVLETAYRRQFERLPRVPIVESTFLSAAQVRGMSGLKMPDALHVACAQENGCAELWTNDNRLAAAAPGFARNILA